MTKQIFPFYFLLQERAKPILPPLPPPSPSAPSPPRTNLNPPNHPHPPPTHPPIPPPTNRQVVKRLKEKTLYYYIQECLSVQDVKMILHQQRMNMAHNIRICIPRRFDVGERIFPLTQAICATANLVPSS